MSSKRIEIFKKASNSQKISLKSHAFLKKASHSQKKALRQLPYCHKGLSQRTQNTCKNLQETLKKLKKKPLKKVQ
jgi:hypothetical protein